MGLNIPRLLHQYHRSEELIHEHFGFEGRWRIMPLEGQLDTYWFVSKGRGRIVFSPIPFTKEGIEDGSEIYSGILHHDEPYRKDDYTMIAVDTQTDGNIVLMVLDNTKETHDRELIELYDECW